MDAKWRAKFSGSKEYLKTLIGWVAVNENGIDGNFFVEEEYRREKLGSYVTLAQLVRGLNGDPRWRKFGVGFVIHSNDVTRKFVSNFLFLNYVFVNNVSSIAVKKRIFDGSAPLYGHL